MGLLILVLVVAIIICACGFISFVSGKKIIGALLCAGAVVASVLLLIKAWHAYTASMDGNLVATYSSKDYKIEDIFLEYYTRHKLHDSGFQFEFKMEFDAEDDEYLEIRRGYGQFEDTITIIYHKYPRDNSFLDPFNLEDYRR